MAVLPPPVEVAPSEIAAAGRPRMLAGIGFLCLAMVLFSMLDASAKWLGQTLPVEQIIFIRYLGGAVVAFLLFNRWTDGTRLVTRRPWLQAVRACCLAGSTACNFTGVRHLTLAESVTVGFAAPLLIAALAGPLLGERIDARRWAAIVVGFVGVVVVAAPDPSHFNVHILWPVGGMVFYAFYTLTTRVLARSDIASAGAMVVFSNIVAVLVFAPFFTHGWVAPPTTLTFVVLAGMGVLGTVGHLFATRAYTLAPAPIIAPFSYSQLLWMSLIGYVIFNDVPTANTGIGAGLVVLSGLYLLYRETARRP